ncbi:hypothetical protein HK096_009807, partial [Nowakowskiella sp. JEL0078]
MLRKNLNLQMLNLAGNRMGIELVWKFADLVMGVLDEDEDDVSDFSSGDFHSILELPGSQHSHEFRLPTQNRISLVMGNVPKEPPIIISPQNSPQFRLSLADSRTSLSSSDFHQTLEMLPYPKKLCSPSSVVSRRGPLVLDLKNNWEGDEETL